ncbi:uncharacterized protein LOC135489957 [Lineus longissimus]|uniref:uncharacterized protein LOC135489957 n=1 Tax=Lineus longissimus TaxID=88925 RepID=UPI00315CA852
MDQQFIFDLDAAGPNMPATTRRIDRTSSVYDVCLWLQENQFPGGTVDAFRDNLVDGSVVHSLKEHQIRELIPQLGVRVKFEELHQQMLGSPTPTVRYDYETAETDSQVSLDATLSEILSSSQTVIEGFESPASFDISPIAYKLALSPAPSSSCSFSISTDFPRSATFATPTISRPAAAAGCAASSPTEVIYQPLPPSKPSTFQTCQIPGPPETLPRPLSLPNFSARLKDSITAGKLGLDSSVNNLFIVECVNYFTSFKSNLAKDYTEIAEKIVTEYPVLGDPFGKNKWDSIREKFINAVLYRRKTPRAKRDQMEKPGKRRQKVLPDHSYGENVKLPKTELQKLSPKKSTVKALLEATYTSRRDWITSTPSP